MTKRICLWSIAGKDFLRGGAAMSGVCVALVAKLKNLSLQQRSGTLRLYSCTLAFAKTYSRLPSKTTDRIANASTPRAIPTGSHAEARRPPAACQISICGPCVAFT